MDSHKTNELYEKFPHLYRERTAPLESSKMGWGFQCEDGWYKIIYEMSKKIDKISTEGEFAPAITEVSRNKDGTLYVEVRNLTPPVADIITTATEQSRLTCEFCAYTPAFLRTSKGSHKGHIACGRCVKTNTGPPKRKKSKRHTKPRRAPDVMVVKR
jgi:hypothetical protein